MTTTDWYQSRLQWLNDIRSHKVYQALSNVSFSHEGNLLEITNEPTSVCQTETIAHYVALARKPDKEFCVLETGTNKGMFALLLDNLGGGKLWTHDCDPRAEQAVKILNSQLVRTQVTFKLGLSQDTLVTYNTQEYKNFFDLFWVDGGHELEPCVKDLQHAVRLEVPYILIDDGNLSDVQQAIREVLDTHPDYVRSDDCLHDGDSRQLTVYRLKV